MAYAKLKKGSSLMVAGYLIKKDSWTVIKDKDVQYLMEHHSARVEFAPAGVVPKDIEKENTDGVIVMDGHGKEGMIKTRPTLSDFPEIDDEEEQEMQKVAEKYAKKREEKENEIKKEAEKKAEEEKQSKAQEAKDKKAEAKKPGAKDITDREHMRKKNKDKLGGL